MFQNVHNKFNRGEIDDLALTRDDYERVVNSAAFLENWLPVRLGPMKFRPGTEYIGDVDALAYNIPFIRSTTEQSLLEFTNQTLRVWTDDELVTLKGVSTTFTNGDFDSNLTGWTDNDSTDCTSAWSSGGYMLLVGNGSGSASRYQTQSTSVTFSVADLSADITSLTSVHFGDSGTKMYALQFNGNLHQYNLSTAYDPSTKGALVNDVTTSATIESYVFFRDDGTLCFIADNFGATVRSYVIPEWDISGGLNSPSESLSFATGNPLTGLSNLSSVYVSPDGTKIFGSDGANARIARWDMSTPWDLSTATFHSRYTFPSEKIGGFTFKPDGTKLFGTDQITDELFEFTLGAAWDILTIGPSTSTKDFSTIDNEPKDIFFKPDGTRFFVAGGQYDTVYTYECLTAWETEQSGVLHTVEIVIERGPVLTRIGTNGLGSDDIFEGELKKGTHYLTFIPTNDITIEFSSSKRYAILVDSCNLINSDTVMSIPTRVGADKLSSIRYYQSADVVFCGFGNDLQFAVERRGSRSWSVVDYASEDGPFGSINTGGVTLTPDSLTGNAILTASESFFRETHVGALFRLTSAGQQVVSSVSAADNGTDGVRVTGVDSSRAITIDVSGTFVATVTLQRSADNATWEDVESYTSATNKSYNDGFDNSIYFYRLYVKVGDYTSGTVELDITYPGGSRDGICQVVAYNSTTSVDVQIFQDFGSTEPTSNWYEGLWSDKNGYPSVPYIHEGRLWWAGRTQLQGSVSDAYYSFDDEIEGDAAAISRTIGFGPVDEVHWLNVSSRLIMGIASDEISVRSNSFSEPLTQFNVNLHPGPNQGSTDVDAIRIDNKIYFVQRSGIKIFQLEYSSASDANESKDLMTLNEQICVEGVKKIAFSRQPETRIWVVMNDGTVRVYLYDGTEDVSAWSRMSTVQGNVEDVVVLPGDQEDRVYFVVNRTSGRTLEKMALISEVVDKHFDSFVSYISPGTTLTGLDHLDGETVHVWADGQYRESATVSLGSITVSDSWASVVVGLQYTALYKSNKLGTYHKGSVLNKRKRVVNLSIIGRDIDPATLKYGFDTDSLYALSGIEGTTFIDEYDETWLEFEGDYLADSRVYLQATGPATIMSLNYGIVDSSTNGIPSSD